MDDSPETREYIEDPNYVPTESDIKDYATYLGIDRATEADLYWIAEEGVRARLPEGWKPCSTRKGQVYYFNTVTGQSSWTHPKDTEFKELLEAERLKKQAAHHNTPPMSYGIPRQGSTPALSSMQVCRVQSVHTLQRDRPQSSHYSSPQSPAGIQCTKLKVCRHTRHHGHR
eukprot:TRINITY_DN10376_c0_g1_i2.p1 TRINITY_DN10376_c0_g1~~TRINITY_DN10376_c0_g1_i2.p1  ORF type:complete len:181 (+),score=25.34 TRINITY_DN10376_c0_g1_i2:32-544(+)